MSKYIPFPAIFHGGDYNPEQWPEAVWDDDVRLMQEAHVNIATVPVFGWVSLQPDEETFTFEWLDRVIEKLHAGGVRICLATATASTPAWLDQKYPDVLRVDSHGNRVKHGGRHTFCPNSPNFRRLASGLAEQLARRYGTNPAVAVWHISNEYGNACYCPQCAAAFRVWLKERYGSLDEVNRRWCTRFWGHTYTDWSQIDTPSHDGERSMQALLIDYDRFQSQSILDCCCLERDAIRKHSPAIPITTNMMGPFKPLDYQKWAKELDIVSWDSYPWRGAKPADIAFNHSLMRGLKEGLPWMLMEQTPSQQNWQAYNSLKRPGVMRLWSYQAMAHGADAIMYFQWRRSRGACEKFHGAVVEHAGRTDARVFQEVAALGRELESLGKQTIGARVKAHAAVLFDWEIWWAQEYQNGPSVDLKYVNQARSFFAALHAQGIPTDIVSPEADLSGYDLVIAPVLYMVKPGIAEKLEAFVRGGGTFLTTYFSGIADETDLIFEGGYPGPLREMLGIWAEEIDILSPQESNSIVFKHAFGTLDGEHRCEHICDLIHLEGAEALAAYGQDFYAGRPALTVNRFGKGRAYYLAAQVPAETLAPLVGQLAAEAGIAPPLGHRAPSGVEVMPRVTPGGDTQIYVLNHNAAPVSVSLPGGSFTDLISGKTCREDLELAGYGVAILTARA
jgi:beta-galactosidase